MKESNARLTGRPDRIEYSGRALSVHRGTTAEPLAEKGFEAVFRNACESIGWQEAAAPLEAGWGLENGAAAVRSAAGAGRTGRPGQQE